MTNFISRTDIIVIGAGVVGLVFANLVASQGFTVTLLEKTRLEPEQNPKICTPLTSDLRCFALSPGSENVLEKLMLWSSEIHSKTAVYERMMVWDGLGFGEISFDAKEISQSHLGSIVEQKTLIQALWRLTQLQKNIVILNEVPQALCSSSEEIQIKLKRGSIVAKLLVGADGANSWVRNAANIETIEEDYRQTAVVAIVKTEFPHQSIAWQRFLPEGPLAFLPLQDAYHCSIVWTLPNDVAEKTMQLSMLMFCESVAKAFDFRLGRVQACSERKSFPLKMLNAKNYIKSRIALLGEAAHVIHPLAGQGMNLGIRDAAYLSEILIQAKQKSCDIGDFLILRKYERARKSQVSRMILSMKFLKELFAQRSTIITAVRSTGLNMTDAFKGLKRRLMEEAMES